MKFISQILKLANNDVTVACSAGVDSVAIAHFLKTKYPKINLKCFHYNHKLRPQNDLMEDAVRMFCDNLGIPLTVSRRALDDASGTSEAALRTLRYNEMGDLLGNGITNVVTGHHLDDFVENYLFNCFNGTPEYLPMPLHNWYSNKLTILRPFALTRKKDIYEYIKNNDLFRFVVEDETNRINDNRRNWLRNELIPQIVEQGYSLDTIVEKRIRKCVELNY